MGNIFGKTVKSSEGVTPSWEYRKRSSIDVSKLRDADDKKGSLSVRQFVKDLAAGSSIEKIADANIIDYEVRAMYGKRYISDRERTTLMAALHKKGEKALQKWARYIGQYERLREFCNRMLLVYNEYDRDVIDLAGRVGLWHTYEKTARHLTTALRYMEEHDAIRYLVEFDEDYRGAIFRQEGDRIIADIYGEGMLYSDIQECAEVVLKDMGKVKAYEIVLYSVLKENALEWLLPFNIEDTLFSLYEPRLGFSDDLPDEFFRGVLRRKALDGEDITEEQERRAVIPEYAEATPDRHMMEIALNQINANAKEVVK